MTANRPMATRPKRVSSNALVVAVLAIALLNGGRHEATRRLQPIQSLPPDVAAIIEDTWDRFAATFPARLECMETVRLELVDDVSGGDAAYLTSERLILIEIPTSPRRFPESLVHELAHHLDSMCADHVEIRHRFATAQGFSDSAEWESGESWEATPSEHFAEAVVEIVTGDRVLHDDLITISPDARVIVETWGATSGT